MPSPALFVTLGLGLLAGSQHAVTGPDHIAGIGPLAASAGRRAWRVGFGWGLGHALGALACAAAALALRAVAPGFEEHISAFSERSVGLLLCFVGVLGLRTALRARAAAHLAEHAAASAHAGASAPAPAPPPHLHLPLLARHDPAHGTSALLLGTFHGAAGLSHLFATLPALALPGSLLPAVYLAGYALGSLACITLVASGIGRLSARRGARHARAWLAGTSALSIGLGLVWIVAPF